MKDGLLIREKVAQATAILNELDVDVWLTFARETPLSPDPALELILGMDVTWHSALLLSRAGKHTAIVGYFDAENVRRLDAYDTVVAYHEGVGRHLRQALNEMQPRQVAVNYSTGDVAADGLSYGMYLVLHNLLAETPYADRLVSAERINGALRGRKSPREIERIRKAVATRP